MTREEQVWADVEQIRAQAPLIHNITNYVVMNNTANALLSLGASPVMAHAEEEIDEMIGIASALVINIGTLSVPWIQAMQKAQRAAAAKGIPIVIDPVGAGATALRTRTVHELLSAVSPTVVRGNASEIMALQQADAGAKGVDSQHGSEAATEIAQRVAVQYDCVVCVSGEVDYIISADRKVRVRNGHALMPRVTGLGCTASSLIGAFCAVHPNAFEAVTHAMVVMGIAGELAAAKAQGPGTLQLYFLDALHNLSAADIRQRIQIEG